MCVSPSRATLLKPGKEVAPQLAVEEKGRPSGEKREAEPSEQETAAKRQQVEAQPQSPTKAAEAYVKKELFGMDGSHDWWHIHRVRNLAMKLATMEGIEDEATRETIEMAALLHDVKDWKYSGSDSAGVEAVEVFLRSLEYPAEKRESILFVISNLGFKEELSNKAKPAVTPELAIVQDADRIDAIGAIGIARCFTFGGSKNQVLHDPGLMPRQGLTKESYMKEKGTTINHFHEKLLLLKDKLKTKSGREVASRRHDFMEEYVARFYQEWDATD